MLCENCGANIKETPYKVRCVKKEGIILCQKCKLHRTVTPEKTQQMIKKVKETCLKKYGVDNVFKTEQCKNKIKETSLEKYGVENPAKSDIVKNKTKLILEKRNKETQNNINQKRKETCLKKYGFECSLQNEEVKEKTKETMLKLYGVENASQSFDICEKKKQTSILHFGVEHPFQSEIVKEKIKNTFIERYGVENVAYSDIITEKIKNTIRKKYGVDCYFQTEEFFKRKKNIKYDGFSFDSSLEIKFYKFLKNKNIKFEMQKKFPEPYYVNGKKHWTFIDFYIPEDDYWIEIKGIHFFNENFEPIYLYGKNKNKNHNIEKLKQWQEKFSFLYKNNVLLLTEIENKFYNVFELYNLLKK